MADLDVDLFDEAMRANLEARLWVLGLQLLKLSQNVVLENGLWSRKERDDKRRDAALLDVDTEMHYFDVPFDELMRRIEIRNVSDCHGTVPLTRMQMEGYAKLFQPPDKAELSLFTSSFVHSGLPSDKSFFNQHQA